LIGVSCEEEKEGGGRRRRRRKDEEERERGVSILSDITLCGVST